MIIRTWGCSITAGYGLNTTYTNVLSDALNTGWVNRSHPGVGNEWILQNLIEDLNGMEPVEGDWYIVQWSGPMRRLHQSIEGKEWTIHPGDDPKYHPKWEPMGSRHTLHGMYCVQEIMKSKGITNWIFWNYFPLDESVKKLNTYNKIEWNRFVDIDREWMIKNNLTWDGKGGHPNLKGVYHIANTLLNKMGYDMELNPETHYKSFI